MKTRKFNSFSLQIVLKFLFRQYLTALYILNLIYFDNFNTTEYACRKELEKSGIGLAQTQAAVKKSGLEMKQQRQIVEEQQKKEEPQIPLADAIRARIQVDFFVLILKKFFFIKKEQ